MLLCSSSSSSQRKQVYDIWGIPQVHGVQRLLRVRPDPCFSVPRHGSASHQLLHLLITQHLPDWGSASRKKPLGCLCLVRKHGVSVSTAFVLLHDAALQKTTPTARGKTPSATCQKLCFYLCNLCRGYRIALKLVKVYLQVGQHQLIC